MKLGSRRKKKTRKNMRNLRRIHSTTAQSCSMVIRIIRHTPNFSKEDADKFLKKEYCDTERGSVFEKLSGLPEPTEEFKMEEIG